MVARPASPFPRLDLAPNATHWGDAGSAEPPRPRCCPGVGIPLAERVSSRAIGPTETLFRDGDAPLLALHGADTPVPLADGRQVRPVHADYAATTHALEAVHAVLERFWPWYGSAHRGAGFASSVTTELLEACRASVANFVAARPDDLVIFTRHTSDAIGLLAHALPAVTDVVSFASEHHANLLPWRRFPGHRLLPVQRSRDALLRAAEQALASCTGPRRLLAVAGASNVTGELLPLAELAAIAHAHGARIFVDAAQLAPHRAVATARDGLDYVAFSGHKLYAPLGAGALVGRGDWLDEGPPYLPAGGAAAIVDGRTASFRSGPARHEGGTANIAGILGLAAACEALEGVGFGRIREHEARLLAALDAGLRRIEGVTLLRVFDDDGERTATVAFRVGGLPAALVASYLAGEHGISVRDGAFCAHTLLRALEPAREASACGEVPSAVRASFGVGSTLSDVQRLLTALDELVTQGPRARYAVLNGRFVPVGDVRQRPAFLRSQMAQGVAGR